MSAMSEQALDAFRTLKNSGRLPGLRGISDDDIIKAFAKFFDEGRTRTELNYGVSRKGTEKYGLEDILVTDDENVKPLILLMDVLGRELVGKCLLEALKTSKGLKGKPLDSGEQLEQLVNIVLILARILAEVDSDG